MKLLVVSHKECWQMPDGTVVTVGGFPEQMEALSELFDETHLFICLRRGKAPERAAPLGGHSMTVGAVPEPSGRGPLRKLLLPFWSLRHLPRLWKEMSGAEVVHAVVPGDVGTLGLLLAVLRGRPLFVRHCGTWGNRSTAADRFLAWLLPSIAGKSRIVFATGGSWTPPCPDNDAVHWIFSTTLRAAEMEHLPQARPWTPERALRLITTARLTRGKNVQATLEALPEILRRRGEATLEILGEGPERDTLERRAAELGISEAVRFRGYCSHDEVIAALARSDLFLFPTRVAEGFPKAVLEAMACGLPVVATAVSALPKLIGDSEAGALLHQPTPEAVADAVVALTSDPETLSRAGQPRPRSRQSPHARAMAGRNRSSPGSPLG